MDSFVGPWNAELSAAFQENGLWNVLRRFRPDELRNSSLVFVDGMSVALVSDYSPHTVFELSDLQEGSCMKQKKTVTIIAVLILVLSGVATLAGILTQSGQGQYPYETIRGETVTIYGKGIYRHMSADVAVQGIAQDYVTLFIALPLLLLSLWGAWKGSLRSRLVLAGTFGYFTVTYLFYTAMGMYNSVFLFYVALLGLSFFGLAITLFSFDLSRIPEMFRPGAPAKLVGGFLVFNSVAIALMWLSVVVPPLLEGTIYPESLQHYTTLIVQGFDLGLLLPIACVTGILLIRKTPLGYLIGTTYIVFLSILMTALTAKIIAMGLNGVNIIPAVFIIPAINLFSIVCAAWMIRSVEKKNP